MMTVGILLAAGHARRFGSDKLAAAFRGKALMDHAAAALAGANVDHRICVGRTVAGFDTVEACGTQSDSLRAGVRAAMASGADRIVIVLADMPLVDTALIDSVIAACPPDGASAASDGVAMPPACFSRAWFPALLAITGDKGAGSLLRTLPHGAIVPANGRLIDIDTPDDLRAIEGHPGWS